MPTQYLIATSIIGWGVGYIFYKIANTTIHPIMVSTITTAVYLVVTPILFLTIDFNKSTTTIGVLATIVGAVLIGAGSIAYYFAQQHGNVGMITATTAMYPVLTMILSCLFMGEELTIRKTIGIILMCISFYFISWK